MTDNTNTSTPALTITTNGDEVRIAIASATNFDALTIGQTPAVSLATAAFEAGYTNVTVEIV